MMKNRRILQISTLAAVLAGAAVVMFAGQPTSSVDPFPAPDWELYDLDGEVVRSAAFEGKIVVLNFWATWCPPCRVEIPGFTQIQAEYQDQGVVIVGVSLDQTGVAGVKEFSKEMGINYPIVMGNQEVAEDFGSVQLLPTTFVIDRNGDIRNLHAGFLSRKALEEILEPLL